MAFYTFCIFYFYLIFHSKIISSPLCKTSEKFCNKCNPLTNLCIKCKYDILKPDNNGGCIGNNKCTLGKNYCEECDSRGQFCTVCEKGYYPDKNGGCSYTENCKISNKGECLECEDNFISIGKDADLKICKSKNSNDFINCKEIDRETGLCLACEDDYFLNFLDKKCSKTENCNESIYGNCISCYIGYYLNKKNSTCLLKINNFLYCKESFDGENCETCDEMTYSDEKGGCALSNYCYESLNGKCQKCIENYYLSTSNLVCSKEKNCSEADKDTGLCTLCQQNYYLDTQDYKCKNNQEDNDFKYCQKVEEGICTSCTQGYKLSKDYKCTPTYNCLEVVNGNCVLCEDNYYLGLDHFCSDVDHCIYSDNYGICKECEDDYYYNTISRKCIEATGKFEHCKRSDGYSCYECRNDFYYNRNKSACLDNTQEGPFYKCALSYHDGEICDYCIDDYFIGSEDNKCTLIENCKRSEDEYTCIECDEYYCLDLKKGTCEPNDYVSEETEIFYFACLRTNKDGNACEQCLNGYEVGKDGYCIASTKCLEEKNGECLKCTDEENENGYSYCANKVYGCVEKVKDHCLRCDDSLDIYKCTECEEGYELQLNGNCREQI